ncbi:MAG TPA: class II aldolase/adducin family protein [Pseudomonadales bacterium]|nr:class II aldolase/adducin family protein [Pseudomonadales bacterium]
MARNEAEQRRDLAAAHRLVAGQGWDDLIFTQLTARIPDDPGHLLVSPFGVPCARVTASSLIKTDLQGRIVTGDGAIDALGFPLYGAIHESRPDVHCVLHLHTLDGIAVSAQRDGLLPLSQTALLVHGDLAYHDYAGLGDEAALTRDLGERNNLILRNHGTLSVGATVADAWARLFTLERACASQVRALAGGASVTRIAESVCAEFAPLAMEFMGGAAGDIAWPGILARLEDTDPDFAD